MMAAATQARDPGAEIAYLTRALKAHTLREPLGRLFERARRPLTELLRLGRLIAGYPLLWGTLSETTVFG